MWKELIGYAVLIFFAAAGIAHALRPERFMKPWHRGGELLTEGNLLGIRLFGVALGAGAIYVLYSITRH